MSSIERLPPDQRAVLALVLQRGRSYDDIAELLAIDRAAVRDRALAALDTLGPSEPQVPAAQRALITDYLLGQLPERVRSEVRNRLATSAPDRAWARVLAGELSPLAANPLPEIPSAQTPRAPAPAPVPEPAREPGPELEPVPASEPESDPAAGAQTEPEPVAAVSAPAAKAQPGDRRPPTPPTAAARPSDRRGGTVLLLLAVLIAAVVVIIVVATSGSSTPKKKATHHPTTTTPATTTTNTSTTAGSVKIVARIVLHPVQSSSKAVGAAEVVTEGNVTGVIVAARHLIANTKHNAYAVWLSAPGGSSHLLGYVSPPVGKSGTLSTTGPLPSNASSYKQLLVTLETTAGSKTPGPAVLQGSLSLP